MKFSIYITVILVFMTSCQTSSDYANPQSTNAGNNQRGAASGKQVLYTAEFDNNDKIIPEDFFIMDGSWEVRKLVNTQALYLRPFPLRTYSLLLGPDIKEGMEMSADVYTSKRGQVFPNFSIGSHGLSGFRLNVKPGPRGSALELFINETRLIAVAKCDWQTDMWSSMRLNVQKTGPQEVTVKGKIWKRGEKEPDWQIVHKGDLPLDEGQCSIWGIPYSGRDIFFDNLVITKP